MMMKRGSFIAASASIAVAGTSLPATAELIWTPDLVHSRAEFLVTHLIVSKVWGHLPFVSLELTSDDAGMPAKVRAVLNPARLDTDNHDRDTDLRSQSFFDVTEFPTIAYESTGFTTAGKSIDGLAAFTCTGELTMKGIRRPVTLTGTIAGRVPDGNGTERIGYSATTTIDRRDFGLTDARMSPGGIPIVGNSVGITLTMEATRSK
jgi:polyisoprenoid-binding protein YceI